MKSNIRNEIKAQIIRAGYTMQEVVDLLHDEYGWTTAYPIFPGKLQRESLRYREAVELADVLGYELVWQKRKDDVKKRGLLQIQGARNRKYRGPQ